jgi:hypothetical protein
MPVSTTTFTSERKVSRDPYLTHKWAKVIRAGFLYRISPMLKINLKNMGRNRHIWFKFIRYHFSLKKTAKKV